MPGQIILQKLRYGVSDPVPAGFYEVKPNRDHGYRQLSPMLLGPVHTGETLFPVSQTLENFWQGSKVFRRDLEADGTVGVKYAASKRKMYDQPKGQRHKYEKGKLPDFAVFYDGVTEVRYAYIDARKFYCNHYAYLARKQPKYHELLNRLQRGENLLIRGFDACPLNSHDPQLRSTIRSQYNDPYGVFGHEKVLFTMLCFDLGLFESLPWPELHVELLYPATQ